MREVLLTDKRLKVEILCHSLPALVRINNRFASLLQEYREKSPSRMTAFNMAISLEESAGEWHYQKAMEMPTGSEYLQLFKTLNKDSRDHADRIISRKNSDHA